MRKTGRRSTRGAVRKRVSLIVSELRSRPDETRRSAAVRRRRRGRSDCEGVTRVKIGDRIAGCFHPRWFGRPIKPEYLTDRLGANLDGMLAEYAVFNEE